MSSILLADRLTRLHPDGRRRLLDTVSLEIRGGDRLALAGPSGSGKTLLLRAMALLDPLDGGEVRFGGHAVGSDAVPAFRRQVAYLHQRATLLADSVEQALRRPFALAAHGAARFDRPRVEAWLADLGRDPKFLDKSVRNLSGGEIQIVALLRALQLDPRLLLLDEPTAAMDPAATAAVEALVDRWVDADRLRRAMVWVSHDAEQTSRLARRVLYMDAGRLEHRSSGA